MDTQLSSINKEDHYGKIVASILKCKTVAILKDAVQQHFPIFIKGRTRGWSTEEMIYLIDEFARQYRAGIEYPGSRPTREYGIRQQLLFILWQEKNGVEL